MKKKVTESLVDYRSPSFGYNVHGRTAATVAEGSVRFPHSGRSHCHSSCFPPVSIRIGFR